MGVSNSRRQFIEQYVVKENFVLISKKTTVCCLTLYNGFEVIGYSSCVDPKAYDREIGERYAKEDALEKLAPFFGFLQVDRAYVQSPSSLPKIEKCDDCGEPLYEGMLRVETYVYGEEKPKSTRCLNCVD